MKAEEYLHEHVDSVSGLPTVETETRPIWPSRPLARKLIATGVLLLILALGAFFRFTGLNWDDNYHLHPDERFLTDAASLLHSTDPITYLRTSESSLNPYNVGRSFYVYGNFPMTVTRLAAEWADGFCQNSESLCSLRTIYYDGIHLVGRFLSAAMDLVTIVVIFLIGQRLYGRRTGLLAALLMAAAVLPIQQSHFFTMDSWAAAFATIGVYTAVRASQDGHLKRWWILFGLALGLAVASRINMAPLAGLAVVAVAVWLARESEQSAQRGGWRFLLSEWGSVCLQRALFSIVLAAAVSLLTFRLAQPYAFADSEIVRQTSLVETGEEPGLLRLVLGSVIGFNPQWRANMEEIRNLQSPEATFPPALQWTDRAPILFPLTNMVLWGMGLTAGVTALIGFAWALWQIIRSKPEWTAHALLVAWSGSYFLFMGTRWVKSIRYFLPVYPVFLLLGAWALVRIWDRARQRPYGRALAASLTLIVVVPTLLWANAFVDTYRKPVTRVEASAWMFDNLPTAATLLYESGGDAKEFRLPLRRFDFAPGGPPLALGFTMPGDGILKGLRFNYLSNPDGDAQQEQGELLHVVLSDQTGARTLSEKSQQLSLDSNRRAVTLELPKVSLKGGVIYTLQAEVGRGGPISAGTTFLANEHWDDSLPVRYEGRDPFSTYFEGVGDGLIPITEWDGEEKREGFYRWLEEADYVILSSQRALWSLPRLPLTYPLTTRYYEALFSGELGFELVKQFDRSYQIGPLHISDVAGRVAWGSPPQFGWPPPGALAVEEAFSVYDHPPVWIFAKSDSYRPEKVREVLGSVDLSQVVIMNPGQATQAPNGLMLSSEEQAVQQANGTFSRIFAVDGLLSRNPGLAALAWWLAVVMLGWLAFPIAFVVFSGLSDRGYAVSRILSLLLVSYFAWLSASLELLPHSRSTLALGLLSMSVASLAILIRRRHVIAQFVRRNLTLLVFIEFFALVLYAAFIVVRLGNPDVWDVIWGGEKPMDLSYFNAVAKSTLFPPYDPWFSGGYINYYYYGFVYVGALTKLLGIVPTVAYNLILPMLFSFLGTGVFSLAYHLAARGYGPDQRLGLKWGSSLLRRKPLIAGMVAALLCVLLGNLAEVNVVFSAWYRASDSTVTTGVTAVDAVIHTVDGALDLTLTDRAAPVYPGDWFWLPSRAINALPGEVQPITEFPFFTFLYGDLHAHLIALPLTVLALSWAVSLVSSARKPEQTDRKRRNPLATWTRWIIGGISIGVLRATNTWDFPTYLLLGALAVAYYSYLEQGRFDLKMAGQAVLQLLALVFLAVLTFLPFAESYGVGYASFSFWPGSYTYLANYLQIYGLFLFLALTYLALELRAWSRTWTVERLAAWEPVARLVVVSLVAYVVLIAILLIKGFWVAPLVLTLVVVAGGLSLRLSLSLRRRVTLILLAAALGLTLMVEFIVLDGDIGRMNTVFKFYLQAWVMLSIVGGVAAVSAWGWVQNRGRFRRVWQLALAVLVAVAALYPVLATRAKWAVRMNPSAPITLDGMAFMESTEYHDGDQLVQLESDYQAIQWMQRNIEGSPVIAEAHSSNPYRSIANRVAMYTGLPAIVGWDWHQRQQRAVVPPTLVSTRIDDLNTLYNTTDLNEAQAILDRYGVKYVYAGELERVYYSAEGLLKFSRMAELGILREVYQDGAVSIFEVVS